MNTETCSVCGQEVDWLKISRGVCFECQTDNGKRMSDARVGRILRTTDSSGRRRARRLS